MEKLNDAKLTLALDKCSFGKSELDFLGFTINENGITPIKKKLNLINNFERPETQKKLLGFLGAISYYRHCLPPHNNKSPADILQSLYSAATSKLPSKTSFKSFWSQNPQLELSFNEAKEMLLKACTLTYPDPSLP